jgi:hypothetical protein
VTAARREQTSHNWRLPLRHPAPVRGWLRHEDCPNWKRNNEEDGASPAGHAAALVRSLTLPQSLRVTSANASRYMTFGSQQIDGYADHRIVHRRGCAGRGHTGFKLIPSQLSGEVSTCQRPST